MFSSGAELSDVDDMCLKPIINYYNRNYLKLIDQMNCIIIWSADCIEKKRKRKESGNFAGDSSID